MTPHLLTDQEESLENRWQWASNLWQELIKSSPSIQGIEQQRLSKAFANQIIIFLPLIILVGMVVMPILHKSPSLWNSVTFQPALIATIISILSYGINRSGQFKLALSIYVLLFISSPWWVVIRYGNISNLPIGALTVAGVMIASVLAPGTFILVVSSALSIAGSFFLPLTIQGVSFENISPIFSLVIILNLIILSLTFFRNKLNNQQYGILQTEYSNLHDSINYSETRLEELIDTIIDISTLDFSARAPIGDSGDIFDGLATGINALGDELMSTAISKKELEELVSVRTSELKDVNAELSSFAYIASHDLKAPLRGISQLSSWMVADYYDILDEEGRKKLNLIVDRTKHMHNLIEGILAYSRIGRLHEKFVKIDLNSRVREIIEILNPPKTIKVTIEDKLPIINGEMTLITQVFQNLLSNAIKYMGKPEGSITIKCISEQENWLFSIEDTGLGIEEKYYDKIFEMFQVLEARRNIDATGVGLSLVKRIVQKWEGKIWVESEVGQGSSFLFTLPKNRSNS